MDKNTIKENKEKREVENNKKIENNNSISTEKKNDKLKMEKNRNKWERNINKKNTLQKHNYNKLRTFEFNNFVNKNQSKYGFLDKHSPPIKNENKEKSNQKNKKISFLKTNGEDLNNSSIRRINTKSKSMKLKNTEKIFVVKKSQDAHITTLNKPKNNLKNRFIDLTDYEINLLEYKDALSIDKRTYFQYYISLIKTRHILIFTFFSYHDYNSLIIKISFFFFSITLFFSINCLFISDSTIHKIKEDGGSFNIEYQLPQIIYSSLISSVVNAFVKAICLTDKNIIQIKNLNTKKAIKIESNSVIKCIIKKTICYFVLTFILLFFFWYYLSCFCAVYRNTQLHLFKDTLISYGFSMIYPFLIYLIPGIFRILALRAQKKDKEIIYKFSKILQAI